jgi:hypothetical protein
MLAPAATVHPRALARAAIDYCRAGHHAKNCRNDLARCGRRACAASVCGGAHPASAVVLVRSISPSSSPIRAAAIASTSARTSTAGDASAAVNVDRALPPGLPPSEAWGDQGDASVTTGADQGHDAGERIEGHDSNTNRDEEKQPNRNRNEARDELFRHELECARQRNRPQR